MEIYSFYSFYKAYPEIFQTLSGKSEIQLSWSHYAILSRIIDRTARTWYEEEAIRETWSIRTLQRQVNINYTCQRTRNFGQKLKHKKQCFISNKRKRNKNRMMIEVR